MGIHELAKRFHQGFDVPEFGPKKWGRLPCTVTAAKCFLDGDGHVTVLVLVHIHPDVSFPNAGYFFHVFTLLSYCAPMKPGNP
jgi:hypothetical protein